MTLQHKPNELRLHSTPFHSQTLMLEYAYVEVVTKKLIPPSAWSGHPTLFPFLPIAGV